MMSKETVEAYPLTLEKKMHRRSGFAKSFVYD